MLFEQLSFDSALWLCSLPEHFSLFPGTGTARWSMAVWRPGICPDLHRYHTGRIGEENSMAEEKEASLAPPYASGTRRTWVSKKPSAACGIQEQSTLFSWKMWQPYHPEGYYYCVLNMPYSPDEQERLADKCRMMYLMAPYHCDGSIKGI